MNIENITSGLGNDDGALDFILKEFPDLTVYEIHTYGHRHRIIMLRAHGLGLGWRVFSEVNWYEKPSPDGPQVRHWRLFSTDARTFSQALNISEQALMAAVDHEMI